MKCIMLVLSVVLAAEGVAAQTQTGAADSWTVPRTSDGHPDLQGIWTAQTFTPLRREAGRRGRGSGEAGEAVALRRFPRATPYPPVMFQGLPGLVGFPFPDSPTASGRG